MPSMHSRDLYKLRRALVKEFDAIVEYSEDEQSLRSASARATVRHINREEAEHVKELQAEIDKLGGRKVKRNPEFNTYKGYSYTLSNFGGYTIYGPRGNKIAISEHHPKKFIDYWVQYTEPMRVGLPPFQVRHNPDLGQLEPPLYSNSPIGVDIEQLRINIKRLERRRNQYPKGSYAWKVWDNQLYKTRDQLQGLHWDGKARWDNPKRRRNPAYEHQSNYKGFEIQRVIGDWQGMHSPNRWGMQMTTFRIVDPSGRPLEGLFDSLANVKLQIDYLTKGIPDEVWHGISGSGARRPKEERRHKRR